MDMTVPSPLIHDDLAATIGRTPLIRLRHASARTGCGILGKAEGGSISEGIGSSRITANFENAPIDRAWSIADQESIPLLHALLIEEDLNLGSSSGVNVAGAIRLAREIGPGHVIVTKLCDSGTRYPRKLFNPALLHEKGVPVPDWLEHAFPPA